MYTKFSLIGAFCLTVLPAMCQGPSDQKNVPQTTTDKFTVEQQVSHFIEAILNRGHRFTTDGYEANTWVPPTQDEIRTIRQLGVSAITPLSIKVDDTNPYVQLLAVRFLGEIGGPLTIEPLSRGLAVGKWSFVRTQSLTSLTNAPNDSAIPIIRGMVNDADPRVRERAIRLISEHYKIR
jgi:hypothetical protein